MSDFCLAYFELTTGRKAYINPSCVSALIEDPKDCVVNICIVGEEGTVLPVRSDIETVANELRKAVTIIEPTRIPSADVAPVVRCKDCKWHQDNATWEDFINHCKWISTETPDDDDFCSYGERRDDEVTAWDYPDGYFEMEKDNEL